MSQPQNRAPRKHRPLPLRILSGALRLGLGLAAMMLLYLAAALVGMLIPVNRGFTTTPDGIPIFVTSNGVHAEVWVPIRTPQMDWSSWLPMQRLGGGHRGFLSMGWGERNFYLETPTWDDLTLANAAYALFWPSACAMHVDRSWSAPRTAQELRLSEEQYAALVAYLRAGFRTDPQGRPLLIDHPGYYDYDAFFEGTSSYHLLRNCNHWTNGALQASGARTALWAPFEASVRYHLPPVVER